MTLNGEEYFYIRNAQNDIIALTDKNGQQVVTYSHDTWGKLISIEGSLKDSVGIRNPYRYRGYRYDSETGLYYLNARYYNPGWGRFINADGLVGIPGELLSHNMFTYCNNNPINMEDPSGNFPLPLPLIIPIVKAVIAAVKVVIVIAAISVVVNTVSETYRRYRTKPNADSTTSTPIAIDKARTKKKKPTFIYRSASGTYTSLTPRPVDTGGLSFYLKPPAKGKYIITSVDAVNATGVLRANIDGANHCSVMPINPLTMSEWINSRPNAENEPHSYTVTLKAIVWDGK